MGWPEELQINAWAGASENTSATEKRVQQGLLSERLPGRGAHLLPTLINPRDWRNPNVGWGLVLPDDNAIPEDARARGDDAPEPLRRLLAARQPAAAVLRYRPGPVVGMLRRYYTDGPAQDLSVGAGAFGVGRDRLPRYLLIYAPPSTIPWRFQYEIQTTHFTGRIDLEGAALERYVNALLENWPQSGTRPLNTLAWAADDRLGEGDITRLMRTAIAQEVSMAWRTDPDLAAGSLFLDGALTDDGTVANLMARLAEHRPSTIVTTSHGRTDPLDDLPAMRLTLGLPVDPDRAALEPAALLADWQPDGAIWYAHACCSAGSDATTAFDGLVTAGTSVDLILKGVAKCGAMVAPLPRALLGATKPLKAFIGHVEPTFDWSIAHRRTGQFMTTCLVDTFYRALFGGEPVGMALDNCRNVADQLLATFDAARDRFIDGEDSSGEILAVKLMHNDWRGLVLLGDPTVAIPVPG